jgi:hypothetical protein
MMRLAARITAENRSEILRAVWDCADGSFIDLVDAPRTVKQNRLMQWLLHDIAAQVPIAGEFRTAEDWKCAFLKAVGQRMDFMPSLDGKGVVCVGYSSKKLEREEMSELITTIYQFGDERGVRFRIDERKFGSGNDTTNQKDAHRSGAS